MRRFFPNQKRVFQSTFRPTPSLNPTSSRNPKSEMDLTRSAPRVNPRPRPPDQALLPLRYTPMMLRRHGVREAHTWPLVGRRVDGYRIQSWRSSPSMAWLQPLVEWARTPLAFVAIVLDIDDQHALELLARANMTASHVPQPNFAIHRTATGHAHAVYTLRRPVLRGAGAKPFPLAVLARIAEWLAIQLQADAGYTGVLAANPDHADYETVWMRTEAYTLDALRDPIPDRWRRPKPPARTDIGRNHDTFKALLRIAGTQGRSDREIAQHAVQLYRELNVNQPHPFTATEMRDIVRSVMRYRQQWRDRGWHTDDFRTKQSICGGRNKPEQQRQKGQAGGVASGQARRARARERDIRILARLAAGESTRQVATAEGVWQTTVATAAARLGVNIEATNTDDRPYGGCGAAGPRRAAASRQPVQGLQAVMHGATNTDDPPPVDRRVPGATVSRPRQNPPISGSSGSPVQGCLPGVPRRSR